MAYDFTAEQLEDIEKFATGYAEALKQQYDENQIPAAEKALAHAAAQSALKDRLDANGGYLRERQTAIKDRTDEILLAIYGLTRADIYG